jgi:hypothetical protein
MEANVFVCQVNKEMSMLSEVFYEYPYKPAGTKKAVDASDIYLVVSANPEFSTS